MVAFVILLIKVMNNTLNLDLDVDTLIGLCFCGIAAEMLFVWMPLLNLNKWYKKMSYFKYLFKTLF